MARKTKQLEYVSITDQDGNLVNVTPSGGLEVSVSQAAFAPRFSHSKTDQTINQTDTVITSVSGEGELSFIMLNFDNQLTEVYIKVDGLEIFRAILSDIGAPGEYNLEAGSVGQPVPIFTESSSKQFFMDLRGAGAHFASNFEIGAKGTTANRTLQAKLIGYRLAV